MSLSHLFLIAVALATLPIQNALSKELEVLSCEGMIRQYVPPQEPSLGRPSMPGRHTVALSEMKLTRDANQNIESFEIWAKLPGSSQMELVGVSRGVRRPPRYPREIAQINIQGGLENFYVSNYDALLVTKQDGNTLNIATEDVRFGGNGQYNMWYSLHSCVIPPAEK